MLDPGKITSNQLSLLLVTLVASTAVLFVPTITAQVASRDGWISILIPATLFGLLVAWVCTSLGKLYPDETVIQYSMKTLGSIPGRIIGFLYVFFFIWTNTLIIREFSEFLVIAFMPLTPGIVFQIVMTLLAAWAVRSGIEVIARMNQFVFPLLVLSFLMLVVLPANEIQIRAFLPIMENGIKPILAGSLPPSAWRGEIVLLLMLLPNLNSLKESRKAAVYAILILAFILTLDTITAIGVFGPELTSHLTFPYFNLARYSRVAMVLERMEALVMLIWVAGVLIKIALFYYCSALALAQLLNLKEFRPLVTPIGILLITWSLMVAENTAELVTLVGKVWPLYAFTFELLVPAVLLIAAKLRRQGETDA